MKVFIIMILMFVSIVVFSKKKEYTVIIDIPEAEKNEETHDELKSSIKKPKSEKIIKYSKKEEEARKNSMFITKGNRSVSYFGFTKVIVSDVSKNGLDFGGDYIFHIDENFFLGLNIDYSLFFYEVGTERTTLSLTNLLVEGILDIYNVKDYSIDFILGAGITIFNIAEMNNATEIISLGLRWNYKSFSTSLKYNLIDLTGEQFQSIAFSFGFLFDLRLEKLNKGYYNDEF